MAGRLSRLSQIFRVALGLGLTSFGGPNAHFATFRRAYVQRLGWLDDAQFAELLALAQSLPGPSSSQLGLAIGRLRGGWWGALAAWAGFTLPSALLMGLLAAFWASGPGPWLAPATHGLLLVAAAVVARAVLDLFRSQVTGPVTAGLAWLALAAFALAPGPYTLPAVLGTAALVGWLRGADPRNPAQAVPQAGSPRAGLLALGLFAGLLLALPWARQVTGLPVLAWADAFYRSGALVFGGGHVVLPLLSAEVVGPGWVDPPAFLAGYAAAQALPGPLFSLAAYLGYLAGGWGGAATALVALFLPGALLMLGALPFWARLRGSRRGRGALGCVAAAVVGLLGSTLLGPVGAALTGPVDTVLAVGLFLLLGWPRVPVGLVVLVGGLAGGAAAFVQLSG